MNKVESIWRHKKSERVAFVTDKGVFVLLARNKHTVDSLRKIVESGDAFLPSEGLNPVELPNEWEEHQAVVKPIVQAKVVNKGKFNLKFSACRTANGFHFYKLPNSDICYWMHSFEANGEREVEFLNRYIATGQHKGSWTEYKKRYNDDAIRPWSKVSLVGKQ